MNARELADLIERGIPYECGNGETSKLIIRALRLLADAEANDGETPQTDDFAEQDFVLETIRLHPKILARIKAWADHARRLERERNGLAARVRELEPDAERYRWLEKYATQYWGGTVGTLPHWYFRGHPYNTLVGYSLSEAIDDARSQP